MYKGNDMKTFAEYLTESKKTYKFKIGLAGDLPEGCVDTMETALQKFGVMNMTAGKKTPIVERPLDFPQLQNMEVTYYDVELAYPTIPPVVAQYLSQTCAIDEAYIIVRTEGAPQEQYQDTEYNKIYEPNLGGDLPESDPQVHAEVGGQRIMGLLAELEKARSERENSPIGAIDTIANKDQIKDMGMPETTSPIGSK